MGSVRLLTVDGLCRTASFQPACGRAARYAEYP